jgi:anthranilate synthase/aminodeoxychorismate synthase-like glutamine amidotransferase
LLLLIDNYDSFTHNLSRYFSELDVRVKVVRNDCISCEEIAQLAPRYIVFSPGPCSPDEAGITLSCVDRFAGSIPMLGVCLGHQAIGQAFGAKVVRAQNIMHGKTSQITHSSSQLFEAIPNNFDATRYHSLLLEPKTIPTSFSITSWCQFEGTQEVMSIEHNDLPIIGVQFHPESLLTLHGQQILANFLSIADSWHDSHTSY